MQKKIGFIGCGNMAQAIMGGIVKSQLLSPSQIIVSNPSDAKLIVAKENYHVQTTSDNKQVAKAADVIILAVKPHLYGLVIDGIKEDVKSDVIIVNIAAGVTLKDTEMMFGRQLKVVKAMPNTPSLVLEGMTAITPNDQVSEAELKTVIQIFEACGKVEVVEERLMNAVTAVSGSSPAYVYLFIEAMADAAVLEGMPRHKAYVFAAQSVLGAAKMVLETGEHPGALKDKVCSPGGTTIEAVVTLEQTGLRSSVMSAMKRCSEKSNEMTNSK